MRLGYLIPLMAIGAPFRVARFVSETVEDVRWRLRKRRPTSIVRNLVYGPEPKFVYIERLDRAQSEHDWVSAYLDAWDEIE